MTEYTEIKTHEEMETLLNSFAGFHDSMTKEIRIINRGFVSADHSMMMSHRFDAQIFIQSQMKSFALELLFCGVITLDISGSEEYCGALGEVQKFESPVEKQVVRIDFDSMLKVEAEQLFIAKRNDWFGAEYRLKGEIPSPGAIPATIIEGNWRQCSDCCDAWEVSPEIRFALCPNCKKLTELNSAEQSPALYH